MKITKPQTTIDNFEFSEPNEAGTVAFFDPTMKDTRGGIAVVRKNDAELIQASEYLLDALIENVEKYYIGAKGAESLGIDMSEKPEWLVNSEKALKKAGCKIESKN